MRQVIYRQPLPPQHEGSELDTVMTVLRFIPLLLAPAALLVFLSTWAIIGVVLLLAIGGFYLYRRFGPPRPVTLHPNFVAINGEVVEVAGPGITKRLDPALRVPLAEIHHWQVYRADGIGAAEGISFTHGMRTYRMAVDSADLFDTAPLEPIAPKVVAAMQRG